MLSWYSLDLYNSTSWSGICSKNLCKRWNICIMYIINDIILGSTSCLSLQRPVYIVWFDATTNYLNNLTMDNAICAVICSISVSTSWRFAFLPSCRGSEPILNGGISSQWQPQDGGRHDLEKKIESWVFGQPLRKNMAPWQLASWQWWIASPSPQEGLSCTISCNNCCMLYLTFKEGY